MASPNLSELITTTLRHRSGKLADNISDNNAALRRLKEKGKIKPFSGGRTIVQELEYAENSTYTRYSGYETLNISPSDVFTAAEFNIKQAAVAVTISGLEQLQNSGKEQVIDLLESRIGNAERTFMNNLSADIYSDGTASGGKQIGGLQLLVADSPSTGTVGGIDRASWNFWRNISYDATTDGGAAATSANIQSYMNRVWLQVVRGTDRPDLIVADNNYFRLYLESLQTIQRITSDKMASAGFTSLKYMDADVVLDGGYGGNAPTNHMYFLNTNYLHFRPHRDRNFVALDPEGGRFSVNQDAIVKLWAWAGNCTLSNAFTQAVLKD
jgi:hypothetical protein